MYDENELVLLAARFRDEMGGMEDVPFERLIELLRLSDSELSKLVKKIKK
ncbi:MAG: hypothetical protein Q8M94_17755 [Ignavibacteria bacterium]|nr:hypothetical protein [Ignavibacteria bacterium]